MNLKQPLESGKDSLKSRLLKMGWQQWATLLLVGLLLVVLALPVSDEGEKKNKTSLLEEEETNSAAKSELETKLEDLLSKVEGVGKVQVLLMKKKKKDPMGFDTGEGTKVTGVLIAAEGADDSVTVSNIQQAVMALFQIEAHKIKVMKMK